MGTLTNEDAQVFVDTSALLALLDASDSNHAKAASVWERLLSEDRVLVATNYVLLETSALAQRRFGLPAVRVVQDHFRPVLHVEWIGEACHEQAMAAVLSSRRRKLTWSTVRASS